MSSISIPCPKAMVPISRRSFLPPPVVGFSQISLLQAPKKRQFSRLKAQVSTDIISDASLNTIKTDPSNGKVGEIVEESTTQAEVPESVISAFMAEVSDLVKLVDSRDIMELHLKQKDCELIIRKKEALPQPAPSVIMMQQSPQAMYTPQPHVPAAPSPPVAASPTSSVPVAPAALPAPSKGSKSSHSLKCPMAGTFYRCPGPGEPPFVKVGDKVKKGQVVCIIEAMKLMNEIEADQDGTVVEVIAEDGKPVSVDTPLLLIEP